MGRLWKHSGLCDWKARVDVEMSENHGWNPQLCVRRTSARHPGGNSLVTCFIDCWVEGESQEKVSKVREDCRACLQPSGL